MTPTAQQAKDMRQHITASATWYGPVIEGDDKSRIVELENALIASEAESAGLQMEVRQRDDEIASLNAWNAILACVVVVLIIALIEPSLSVQ